MSSQSELLLLLSVVILMPVIPAAILYSILPSTGNVKGKLQGTEIKLGGAFAGYFALVVLVISQLSRMYAIVNPPPPPPLTQIWDVEGQMVDEHGLSIQPLTASDVAFQPNTLTLNKDGLFKATFVTQLTQTAGMEFPKLLLSHEGYFDTTIDLGPPGPNGPAPAQDVRDEKNHMIKLKRIVLTKQGAYSDKGTSPQPVDPHAYAVATGGAIR